MSHVNKFESALVRSEDFSPSRFLRTKVLTTNLVIKVRSEDFSPSEFLRTKVLTTNLVIKVRSEDFSPSEFGCGLKSSLQTW